MRFQDYAMTPHESALWLGKGADSETFRAALLATAKGIANREQRTVLVSATGEDARTYLVRTVSPDWTPKQRYEPTSRLHPEISWDV